jgi:trehalose-6-phosphate hydrolase
VGKNYQQINAKNALKDPNSIFYHYQQLIRLRKEMNVIAYGTYQPLLEEDAHIFAYVRSYQSERLLVINNFFGQDVWFELPGEINFDGYESRILIANYEDSPKVFKKMKLRPYEAIVYHLEK